MLKKILIHIYKKYHLERWSCSPIEHFGVKFSYTFLFKGIVRRIKNKFFV